MSNGGQHKPKPKPKGPKNGRTNKGTGTEPVTSPRECDSWQGKLALYEHLRDACGYRFRVLGVLTCGEARLEHICHLAARVAHDPRRPLFYGVGLADYLSQVDPMTRPCFRDHRGQVVALVPPERTCLAPLDVLCYPLPPAGFPPELQTA